LGTPDLCLFYIKESIAGEAGVMVAAVMEVVAAVVAVAVVAAEASKICWSTLWFGSSPLATAIICPQSGHSGTYTW
jgi:hypothetical protein